MKGEELILGVSNAPLLNELLYAEAGSGAFLNGEPITVSSVTHPKDAMAMPRRSEVVHREGHLPRHLQFY